MTKTLSRFLFLSLILLTTSGGLCAQNVLPNIAFNGQLTSACATPNAACTNQVFVTTNGSPGVPQTSGAGSTLDVPTINYAAATVTISGTYSGVTIAFDFSDPTSGTNYFQQVCARTDINLLESSEVVPTNQIRAWSCPVWASTRFRVRASAFGSGSANINIVLTQAAIDPSLVVAASVTNIAGASDPCADVSATKQSFQTNITTATTTALVAVSGTTQVYVCGYQIQGFATTTANTVQLEYGSGAACVTSPTALTPVYNTGVQVAGNPPFETRYVGALSVLKPTPSGTGLCAVTTVGSTPSINILVTYVQQ